MKNFLRKLTSRKFLAAAAGVITGLAMVFGLDEGIVSTVAGAVTALSSVLGYIVTEGSVDAAAVRQAAQAVEAAKEAYTDAT